MNKNCMITREAALEFGLSFQNTYTERPFRDQNWQVVRARENKKIFLWIYERNGYVNLNVKQIRSGVIFGEVPMNLYRLVIIRIRNIGIPLF